MFNTDLIHISALETPLTNQISAQELMLLQNSYSVILFKSQFAICQLDTAYSTLL